MGFLDSLGASSSSLSCLVLIIISFITPIMLTWVYSVGTPCETNCLQTKKETETIGWIFFSITLLSFIIFFSSSGARKTAGNILNMCTWDAKKTLDKVDFFKK